MVPLLHSIEAWNRNSADLLPPHPAKSYASPPLEVWTPPPATEWVDEESDDDDAAATITSNSGCMLHQLRESPAATGQASGGVAETTPMAAAGRAALLRAAAAARADEIGSGETHSDGTRVEEDIPNALRSEAPQEPMGPVAITDVHGVPSEIMVVQREDRGEWEEGGGTVAQGEIEEMQG